MAKPVSKLCPSLSEYLEGNKKSFDIALKAGVVKDGTWPEQESFLKGEWEAMSKMDDEKFTSYMKVKYERELPRLQAYKEHLDKMLEAVKLKQAMADDIKEIKAEAEWRKKNKRG